MNDRGFVYFSNAFQDSIAQLLPGLDANMPEKSAGHFAEHSLDNIEPRAVSWSIHVLEAIGSRA